MSWKLKILVFTALGALLVYLAGLGYLVYARYQANEYVLQVAAAFNAASLVNGEETYTEPDKAVIADCEGKRYVILPENYRAIIALLRKDHAMPMFRRVGKDAPLKITICDSAVLRIKPDEGSIDGALVSFTNDAGKRFTMHVRGGNIWKQILGYTTTGSSEYRNLPL